MATVAPLRVHQTSVTNGTGSYTLVPATGNNRNFRDAYSTGATVPYVAADSSGNYEIAVGTLTTGTSDTIGRTAGNVFFSSAGAGTLVNWSTTSPYDVFAFEMADTAYPRAFSSAETYTVADWGTLNQYQGTGGHTWTLPALSGVPAGYSLSFSHEGTGVLTVAPSGSDTILGAGVQTSWVNGNSGTFIATPTGWALMGGPVNSQYLSPTVNLGSSLSGSVNIDLSAGDYFYGTVTGNVTFAITNAPPSGVARKFKIDLTGSGNPLITWPAGFVWPGGISLQVLGNGSVRGSAEIVSHDGFSTAIGQIVAEGLICSPSLMVAGGNGVGQLGTGDITARQILTPIATDKSWACIAVGTGAGNQGTSSFGITTSGKLYAWGDNLQGELGLGFIIPQKFSSPVQVGARTDWKTVASSGYNTFALTTDGTMFGWGANSWGQLGQGDVISRSSPVQVGAASSWAQVVSGGSGNSTVALTKTGKLYSWGLNTKGELGLGDILPRSSPVQIGALTTWAQISGGYSCIAISTSGKLYGWGANSVGQLGLGDVLPRSSPVQIGAATNWVTAVTNTSGFGATLAINATGAMFSCGSGSHGQLGSGATTSRSTLAQIGTGTAWVAAFTGGASSFAINSFGNLYAMGSNAAGQLGLGPGALTDHTTPTLVGTTAMWAGAQIATGGQGTGVYFTLAIHR